MALYRALLHLLPKDWRQHDGAQMAAVFADLAAERRGAAGRLAVGRLWIAEMTGLLRFALRERVARIIRACGSLVNAGGRDGGPGLGRELRWAWRGLLARGWRGGLVVSLLALAMAANAIVFASADSFVFNRVPYRDANRLVEIGEQSPYRWAPAVWPELVSVWRKQTDLFADVQAHTYGGPVYLSGSDDPRFTAAEDLTPGLVEMLGARPAWGRSFTTADVGPGAEPVVLLAEEVAAKEFGGAQQAVGQMLSLGDKSARVVGVMPAAFRFPSGAERVWLPLDLSTGTRTLSRRADRPNGSGHSPRHTERGRGPSRAGARSVRQTREWTTLAQPKDRSPADRAISRRSEAAAAFRPSRRSRCVRAADRLRQCDERRIRHGGDEDA